MVARKVICHCSVVELREWGFGFEVCCFRDGLNRVLLAVERKWTA